MSSSTVFAGLIPLLFTFSFGLEGSGQEEEQIRQMFNNVVSAWRQGDPVFITSEVGPEADVIDPEGRTFKGIEAIRQAYSYLSAWSLFRGSELELEIDQVRFITNNVAIVDGTWHVTRFYGQQQIAPGNPMPSEYMPATEGLFAAVLQDSKTGWLFHALRIMKPDERLKAGP